MDVGGQDFAHLLRAEVVVVIREEQTGLLLVAHKTIDLLQEIAALHGNAHIGNGGKDLFVVFLCVGQNLLDGVFFQIQFQCDGVAVGKDLVALFLQQGGKGAGVRPFGDGSVHIAVVVKDGQPGAHAVRDAPDVLSVHLVVFQLVDDVLPHAGVIHQTDKGGAQLHIGDVLGHIAAHAAVHLLDAPGVAAARDISRKGVALDIHKNSSEYDDSHKPKTSFKSNIYLYYTLL